MSVVLIDYGMGNLGSVRRAVGMLGAEAIVADQPEGLEAADYLILPGVGSYSEGMARLQHHGWRDAIRKRVDAGSRLLGICLGMQLLSSVGTEGGETAGLDLIPGRVMRLDALGCSHRIPHVGWNNVRVLQSSGGLFHGIPDGTDFYFVHSFALIASDPSDVTAQAEYGIPLAAAVARGSVFGTQFHPEKSSRAGFRILKNFLDSPKC